MWGRYFRLFSVALFVWIAVLGWRAGSWRLVVVPFLALGALLIARDTLRERHQEFGRQLAAALVTLVLLYNVYFSVPAVRSWLESQFPQTTAESQRLKDAIDLGAAEKLEERTVALAARKALHEHLLRKEDIVGEKIKAQLDALDAKRQQGTFGGEDEKKEREVLKQFQKLVQDSNELQQLIAGTPAEELSPKVDSTPAPPPPQSVAQQTTSIDANVPKMHSEDSASVDGHNSDRQALLSNKPASPPSESGADEKEVVSGSQTATSTPANSEAAKQAHPVVGHILT